MVARRICQDLGVGWREVCERIAFEVSPKHLDRIDVGGVRRQEFAVQLAMALEEPVDDLGSVRLRAVPNDDQRFLELRGQVAQKAYYPTGREVRIGEQGKVKSYPLPVRRDRERRDGGHLFVPSSAVQKNWRPAARGPCPADQRRHHKAALVDEDDVGVQAAGFFLMRAQSSLIHF